MKVASWACLIGMDCFYFIFKKNKGSVVASAQDTGR